MVLSLCNIFDEIDTFFVTIFHLIFWCGRSPKDSFLYLLSVLTAIYSVIWSTWKQQFLTCVMCKAIIDIRLCPRSPFHRSLLRPIGCIACTQKFLQCYLPAILNDPFCCMTLLAIEWFLLQRTHSDRWSKDCQCFWMARTTPNNCAFLLGDLQPDLLHLAVLFH